MISNFRGHSPAPNPSRYSAIGTVGDGRTYSDKEEATIWELRYRQLVNRITQLTRENKHLRSERERLSHELVRLQGENGYLSQRMHDRNRAA